MASGEQNRGKFYSAISDLVNAVILCQRVQRLLLICNGHRLHFSVRTVVVHSINTLLKYNGNEQKGSWNFKNVPDRSISETRNHLIKSTTCYISLVRKPQNTQKNAIA